MYSLAPSTSALMTKTPPLKMICVPKDTIFLSLKKKASVGMFTPAHPENAVSDICLSLWRTQDPVQFKRWDYRQPQERNKVAS